jgi:proteasome lid subunit RPN8/RPN11
VRIPNDIRDRIFEQAGAELPNECCGLIGGRAGADGEARTLYPARNAEASPFRYLLHPQDQLRISDEMEERGEELAAIYHSHTKSAAYPSQTDINLALVERRENGKVVERIELFPGTIYLIASLAEDEVALRGFNIDADGVHEVELKIE